MKITKKHNDFKMPARGTDGSAGYDIFMPTGGHYSPDVEQDVYPLGFALEIPKNHAALVMPRSGAGFNFTVEINNSLGLIDWDYTGQWMAKIRTKDGNDFKWNRHDRILQFIVVPVFTPELEIVDELSETDRGVGGIGSTGL